VHFVGTFIQDTYTLREMCPYAMQLAPSIGRWK
jgi:hypothetical protein